MPPENNELNLAVMAHKIDTVHVRISDVQASMNKMTDAIVKLALIEERQSQFAITQERSFKTLERVEANLDALEKRITELEIAEPMQKQTSNWMMAAVWGFAGLMAASLIHKITDFIR